jgi:hypothetical protein
MTTVDPFLQPMPEAFYSVFPAQDQGAIKARFEYEDRWRHDMWIRTGGGTDKIEQSLALNVQSSNDLRLRLGSGIPFTTDSSGFTTDISYITTDKSEQ